MAAFVINGDATMRCKVMGIVNVTPDSFSDGGKFFRPEEAIRRARNLAEEGAAIIDLGGESTRPGATPLGWEEEWSRLEPVVTALGLEFSAAGAARPVLSVDTYHPETAARAIDAGVTVVNCVRRESVPAMLRILEAHPHVELVMPCRGERDLAPAGDFLDRLYLDPMVGFGTTREEDLALLRSIGGLKKLGRVLVGASRKRIVKKLTGEKVAGKDLAGNLAIAAWAALGGADVVRVHDVRETVQALKVLSALASSTSSPQPFCA